MSLQDEIAKVAHELYEKSGRIGGRDMENWIEAERIVMERHKGQKKTSSKAGAKKTETKKAETKKAAAPKTTVRAKKTK
ncbi:MAG: DUF2934 domain-containing protein [Nitrospirae bacterium]|nr:DUF2934 domain-containing protein [Nitrospirota bacterium]MDA8215325.1 DUF2934 domain-containing protein [Nitrospiraceae bacterium]MDA8340531.1 DUF2934 domain-containing protein [Nitrospiraceae bacterium]